MEEYLNIQDGAEATLSMKELPTTAVGFLIEAVCTLSYPFSHLYSLILIYELIFVMSIYY